MMLMLDRCVFSNSFTLADFHTLFMQIYAKGKDQKTLQDEKTITKDQLIAIFNETAKALFRADPKYLHRFYNTFLSEKVDSEHGEINHSRVMVFDATNTRLIT